MSKGNIKIWVDVLEFEAALKGGEPRQAVEVYAGPFLDGFYLNGTGEFERWMEAERDRVLLGLLALRNQT